LTIILVDRMGVGPITNALQEHLATTEHDGPIKWYSR